MIYLFFFPLAMVPRGQLNTTLYFFFDGFSLAAHCSLRHTTYQRLVATHVLMIELAEAPQCSMLRFLPRTSEASFLWAKSPFFPPRLLELLCHSAEPQKPRCAIRRNYPL